MPRVLLVSARSDLRCHRRQRPRKRNSCPGGSEKRVAPKWQFRTSGARFRDASCCFGTRYVLRRAASEGLRQPQSCCSYGITSGRDRCSPSWRGVRSLAPRSVSLWSSLERSGAPIVPPPPPLPLPPPLLLLLLPLSTRLPLPPARALRAFVRNDRSPSSVGDVLLPYPPS